MTNEHQPSLVVAALRTAAETAAKKKKQAIARSGLAPARVTSSLAACKRQTAEEQVRIQDWYHQQSPWRCELQHLPQASLHLLPVCYISDEATTPTSEP